MNANIILERKESFLKEIISEALGSLQDSRLNSLEVTQVQCSKGKYNAKVFIEASSIDEASKKQISQAFKKAMPLIQKHILNITTWHSVPKLSLEFDNNLQIQNRLENIFAQIHKNNL